MAFFNEEDELEDIKLGQEDGSDAEGHRAALEEKEKQQEERALEGEGIAADVEAEQAEQEELEAEAEKQRDAMQKIADHEEELGGGANVQEGAADMNEMVQGATTAGGGDVANARSGDSDLDAQLSDIIKTMANAGVKAKGAEGAKSAGIDGKVAKVEGPAAEKDAEDKSDEGR